MCLIAPKLIEQNYLECYKILYKDKEELFYSVFGASYDTYEPYKLNEIKSNPYLKYDTLFLHTYHPSRYFHGFKELEFTKMMLTELRQSINDQEPYWYIKAPMGRELVITRIALSGKIYSGLMPNKNGLSVAGHSMTILEVLNEQT